MILDNKAIGDTISKYLASQPIPAGHRGALVTMVDKNGVTVVVATKFNGDWQMSGSINYVPHTGGLDAGISLSKTW